MTLARRHSKAKRKTLKPGLDSHMTFFFKLTPELIGSGEAAGAIDLVFRSQAEASCLSSINISTSMTSLKQGCAPQHLCKGGGKGLTLRKKPWPLLIWELGAAAGSASDPPVFGCQSPVHLSFQPDFNLTPSISDKGCVEQKPTTSGLHDTDIHVGRQEALKKNPRDGFTPENDCPPFTSHSLALMPFVLKLPKTANEKGFLRENNVVQFPEVFYSWSRDSGRILLGCRELWDKQMIWAGGSACNLLWEKKHSPAYFNSK